jgi:hypothetical protein
MNSSPQAPQIFLGLDAFSRHFEHTGWSKGVVFPHEEHFTVVNTTPSSLDG